VKTSASTGRYAWRNAKHTVSPSHMSPEPHPAIILQYHTIGNQFSQFVYFVWWLHPVQHKPREHVTIWNGCKVDSSLEKAVVTDNAFSEYDAHDSPVCIYSVFLLLAERHRQLDVRSLHIAHADCSEGPPGAVLGGWRFWHVPCWNVLYITKIKFYRIKQHEKILTRHHACHHESWTRQHA